MDELREEVIYAVDAVDRLRHESSAAIAANTAVICETRSAFTDIRDYIQNLAKVTDLLYSALGVTIYNDSGSMKDVEDIREELVAKNPSITLPFEDLMNFNQ